jgi:hypothetical protein
MENDSGNALLTQVERKEGNVERTLPAQAVQAYRNALQVCTREQLPRLNEVCLV